MSFKSDKVHDPVINMTIEYKIIVLKLTLFVKITVPEDKFDQIYRREIFHTTIDMEKMFKGLQGSYFAKTLMENLLKSANFGPDFPIQKVK
jgi:ABC-type transport system involved in Fe-S cluster assembly fused permease/ATPase subunit